MSTTVVTPELPQFQAPQLKVYNNILENSLLLVLTRKWIPTTKTISSKVLQSSAQSSMINVTKKLFNSQQLRAISSNETKLDEYIRFRATPIPLKKGHHLLAADLFHDVEQALSEHVQRRVKLIDDFVAVYDQAVEEAKTLLGDQFDVMNYPSKEQVKSYFFFSWEYLQFGISAKLQELDKEVAERKEQQFQTQIIQAGEAAQQLLRAQMKGLVDHLVERLKPVEKDGELKKQVFRDSIFEKINDFTHVFSARNLAQDGELQKLVNQAQSLMTGVAPEVVRSDDSLRTTICEGFSKVKENLDKLISEQPIRAISFD